MKKIDKNLLVAMEFETIVAAPSGKRDGVNNRLYAIEGRPGIYRRVARSTTGLTSPEGGNLLAQFDGSIVELAGDCDICAEIKEALPDADGIADRIWGNRPSPEQVKAFILEGQGIQTANQRFPKSLHDPVGQRILTRMEKLADEIEKGETINGLFIKPDLAHLCVASDFAPIEKEKPPCLTPSPKNEDAGSPETPTAPPTTGEMPNLSRRPRRGSHSSSPSSPEPQPEWMPPQP